MERRTERSRAEDQGWKKFVPHIMTIGICLVNVIAGLGGYIYFQTYGNLRESIADIKLTLVESQKDSKEKFKENDTEHADIKKEVMDIRVKYVQLRNGCCSEVPKPIIENF